LRQNLLGGFQKIKVGTKTALFELVNEAVPIKFLSAWGF
jgi:hypothetical protein